MKVQRVDNIVVHKEKKEKKFVSPLEKPKREKKEISNRIIFCH